MYVFVLYVFIFSPSLRPTGELASNIYLLPAAVSVSGRSGYR